ncbi:MAG: hypothetical protein R3F56_20380 [Planctomycetota bacterium]
MFLAELADGHPRIRRRLDQPVLIYHIPRTGGSFLCNMLQQLDVLVLHCDVAGDWEACARALRGGTRGGLVILGHTAKDLKAAHRDVSFAEYAVCWRDPFEICASEYHGIRNAVPGYHLFDHHLRRECLACGSLAEWVETYQRNNPISKVLGDNTPTMLHAMTYARDVEALLLEVFGLAVDVTRDFGFDPGLFRPGRWASTVDTAELRRLYELNREDHELGADACTLAAGRV